MKNIVLDELYLLEQKDRIEDIDNIQQKSNPDDINNDKIKN